MLRNKNLLRNWKQQFRQFLQLVQFFFWYLFGKIGHFEASIFNSYFFTKSIIIVNTKNIIFSVAGLSLVLNGWHERLLGRCEIRWWIDGGQNGLFKNFAKSKVSGYSETISQNCTKFSPLKFCPILQNLVAEFQNFLHDFEITHKNSTQSHIYTFSSLSMFKKGN